MSPVHVKYSTIHDEVSVTLPSATSPRTPWVRRGAALLGAGVTAEFINAGTVDPQVVLPGGDGKKGSLFDQLEDMDVGDCVAKVKEIADAASAY